MKNGDLFWMTSANGGPRQGMLIENAIHDI